jgi:hypothetical protein
MGSISWWQQRAFADLVSLGTVQPQENKPVDEAGLANVTAVPGGQPTKSLGFADRILVNRLYQQVINKRSSVASFFLAIFRPKKVNDTEIQNLSRAASAIVQKRNALAQPRKMGQPSTDEMLGVKILSATSGAIDGANFFARTRCDPNTFFQLLEKTLEQNVNLNFIKFNPVAQHAGIVEMKLSSDGAPPLEPTNRENGKSNEIKRLRDKHIRQAWDDNDLNEVRLLKNRLIPPVPGRRAREDGDFEGVTPKTRKPESPKRDTTATAVQPSNDGFEYLRDIKKRAKDSSDISSLPPPRNAGRKILTRRPAAAALDDQQNLAGNPADKSEAGVPAAEPRKDELTGATGQPGATPEPTEPVQPEPVQPEPSEPADAGAEAVHGADAEAVHGADAGPEDGTAAGAIGQPLVDQVADTAPAEAPARTKLTTNGDKMTMEILRKIKNDQSCVVKNTLIFSLEGIKVITSAIPNDATGRALDDSNKYDKLPAITFFKGNEQHFNIEAHCEKRIFADYYYTIALKDGFSLIEEGGEFFVEKIEDTETYVPD